MVGFSADSLRLTVELFVGLVVGMIAREYARAWMASRCGDPTPRLWGRLTLDPRRWFEPFGSGLLPGLILFLWLAAASFLPPPVAYAKPAPIDPSYFRNRTRDAVLSGFAGPVANLALAAFFAIPLRAGLSGNLHLVVIVLVFTNLCLTFFHLLPIPGLDGARLVALALPPRAAEVYRNLDQYLPLFVLLVLFLFAAPILSLIYSLTSATCHLLAGTGCSVV